MPTHPNDGPINDADDDDDDKQKTGELGKLVDWNRQRKTLFGNFPKIW